MKIVALLSWWDEHPDWLTDCVTSAARLADHVVAVDGRYADFPGSDPWSRHDQAEAILGTGVPVTVHLPRQPWPSEVVKRDFMFRLVAPLEPEWLFRIDADELVTAVPHDARERLADTQRDVAEVYLDEAPPGTPGPLRALFRALPGIRVTHAHSLVTVPTSGRTLLLAGDPGLYELDPAEPLHDIRLEHRRHQRPRARREQKNAYYRLMPQLEARWTP